MGQLRAAARPHRSLERELLDCLVELFERRPARSFLVAPLRPVAEGKCTLH